MSGMGEGEGKGRTEETGAHGRWVLAYPAQRLDPELGALEFAYFEVAQGVV